LSQLDLVLRRGRIVDGSGLPPYVGDVGILRDRIVAVGRVDATGVTELDASGCMVAPGFVDIHTHYDAQLHFEPTASPSSWHGVTTVVVGNCGFSLFPARADDVGWLLALLSRVEGMSLETLAEGVTFTGGGFDEFASGVDGRLGVNVLLQVGHSALRRRVMGDHATTRVATSAEVDEMVDLLRAALDAGAVGFTSSQLDLHVDHDGKPVPSNLADRNELVSLARVLRDYENRVIEFISRSNLDGHDPADRALMLAMCDASGAPMNINPLQRLPMAGDEWHRGLDFVDEAAAAGHRVHPQSSLQQMQVFFSFADTFLFDEMPAFREALTGGTERERMLADSERRARMRAEFADTSNRAIVFPWDAVRVARTPDHPQLVGVGVVDEAARAGVDPLDWVLDLSLDESLRTVFTLGGSPGGKSRAATVEVLQHPASIPGSSDAGAHLSSYCGVDYSTRLLTEYVPDALSLEEAVRRLSTIPAAMYGFTDRGVVRSGAAADLVVWDPETLGVGPTRWVEDFPAGGGRFVVESTGYRWLIVNGQVVMVDGDMDTGARPGRVLRSPSSA
jgi:N-acyl-D-aspartate/D-glutamate deacylase